MTASAFYDDSILSGTKTETQRSIDGVKFYDDSILSGTKTVWRPYCVH